MRAMDLLHTTTQRSNKEYFCHGIMSVEQSIKEENGYRYIATNPGAPVLLLLHGLFGALSNFRLLIEEFAQEYNVVVPMLPIYEMELKETGLGGLLSFTESFIDHQGYSDINIVGNSLGGHIALMYAIKHQDMVSSLILTGSSGLFESGMGDGYPRRGDKDYIARKIGETFYDPVLVDDNLVNEVFDTINNREKAIRIVITAKTALKHNLEDQLHKIKCPTLLVWGNQDTITPPFVAEKFDELIPNTSLHFIDKCGHAPMMEVPQTFNEVLSEFLHTVKK